MNARNYWIYGKYSVIAALQNPNRMKKKLVLMDSVIPYIENSKLSLSNINCIVVNDIIKFRELARISDGVVHQGFALQTMPLNQEEMENFMIDRIDEKKYQSVVILDKVCDPHNIGAIMRTCAAFNVIAVITTRIDTPYETPAIVKAACGGFENVAFIKVTNLANAMQRLKLFGFSIIGFDAISDTSLSTISNEFLMKNQIGNCALVFGGEERGMRNLTKKTCDFIVKIDMIKDDIISSINVSNAAAIGLHHFYNLLSTS